MKSTKHNGRLMEAAAREGCLAVAHRGVCGASIIENTVDAFDAAILQHSDMVELDILCSLDRELFVMHEDTEKRLLQTEMHIPDMTAEQVLACAYYNAYGYRTRKKVNTLRQVLLHLKNRTLINLDGCWGIWDDVLRVVAELSMFDQVLIKSPPQEDYLAYIAAYPEPVMYMPVIRTPQQAELVMQYDINLVGLELVFATDDNPLLEPERMRAWHERGLLLWANALTIHDGFIVASDHDDQRAMTGDMEGSWGWLLDRGFRMIQTDWPATLKEYCKGRCLK